MITLALLAGALTACGDGGRTGAEGAGGVGTANAPAPPMPPSGMPMEHMDMPRAMAGADRGLRSGFCAVGPAAGAEGRASGADARVTLMVDSGGAGRPTRIAVTVATAAHDGLAVELIVDGRARATCSGDDLMIAGVDVAGTDARLGLASRGAVTVIARTADDRVLAGPLRVGPGAPGAVLAWGGTAP